MLKINKTIIADFKPLSFKEWKEYIKKQNKPLKREENSVKVNYIKYK